MVDEIVIISVFMMIAFIMGAAISIVSSWSGALFTRKAHTNEPLFYEHPKEEVEEVTKEEKEKEDHDKMQQWRGQA